MSQPEIELRRDPAGVLSQRNGWPSPKNVTRIYSEYIEAANWQCLEISREQQEGRVILTVEAKAAGVCTQPSDLSDVGTDLGRVLAAACHLTNWVERG